MHLSPCNLLVWNRVLHKNRFCVSQNALLKLVSEFGCLMPLVAIFQLNKWWHIYVQADWSESWTYDRASKAINICTFPLQARPSIDTVPPFYGLSEKPPHLVASYDTLEMRETVSHLKPPGTHGDALLNATEMVVGARDMIGVARQANHLKLN